MATNTIWPIAQSKIEKKNEKEMKIMYELTSSIVNIAFYVLAAIVIIGSIIKIVKSKKDKDNAKKD